MRSTRLFTLTVAASLTAVLTPVTASAALAATARPEVSNPGVSMWSRPFISGPTADALCPSGWDLRRPSAMYQVKNTGVAISASPGGAPSSAIGSGTLFASEWVVRSTGGYQCVATADGRTWVLGVSQSGAIGWLAAEYLSQVTSQSNAPTA
jgi:hypothetical protein